MAKKKRDDEEHVNLLEESTSDVLKTLDLAEKQIKECKDEVKKAVKGYKQEAEACDTCDAAEPYKIHDSGGCTISETRIQCSVFKTEDGGPLIIGKGSVGCFEHNPRR
ncbi:hypothetical protein KKE14_01980 [Patescibacteria group bacterium]|nr:hypothetical protein [Patescibacteria group bacterium]